METIRTNERISLSKILVTTNFSQVSKTALAYATALANQYEAKIVIAHAISPEPPLSLPLVPLPVESDPVRLRAEAKLLDFVLGSNSIGQHLPRCCYRGAKSGMLLPRSSGRIRSTSWLPERTGDKD